MSMNFCPPDEVDFFERDFYPSDKDDNDEGVISYVRHYRNGRELTVTFFPYGVASSVSAEIIENGSTLASITRDNVSNVVFQSWNGEQVIRVYGDYTDNELIIYYNPNPRIFYGELANIYLAHNKTV